MNVFGHAKILSLSIRKFVIIYFIFLHATLETFLIATVYFFFAAILEQRGSALALTGHDKKYLYLLYAR